MEAAATDAADSISEAIDRGMDAAGAAGLADLSAFDDLAQTVGDELAPVHLEQSLAALESLNVDKEDQIVNLLNHDALHFARERGAELVGKKWIGDLLVDNPDARWAITESTRDGLRELLVRSYEEGFTPAKLRQLIESTYDFSRSRAEMIARTETAKASTQGTLAGWRRSGVVVGKKSLVSGDHDLDDECDDNMEAGEIGLDEMFPSGDDGPPYHPRCNCVAIAVLGTISEEEGDEE